MLRRRRGGGLWGGEGVSWVGSLRVPFETEGLGRDVRVLIHLISGKGGKIDDRGKKDAYTPARWR